MIKTAVMGFGIVGSGVVHVLDKNSEKISQNAGRDISVKYILDIRNFPDNPYNDLIINDFEKIVNDPEVSVVIEAIGGVDPAYIYVKRCLEASKSVVTSNKELVAEHGSELIQLAKEKNVNFLFEASVGGGIPVIRPIAQCMTANTINEIYGILNGTTNYILTDMDQNGADFSDALLEAQKMGYAEADPTADIEGHDTCRKICILSSLAFGSHIFPKDVPTEGITTISLNDIKYADSLGYKIKLLGRARMTANNASIYTAPHLVSKHSLLTGVDGVMNAVVVRGNMVGNVIFCGAGAGKLPTASAVVADVIDAVKHLQARRQIGWDEANPAIIVDSNLLESSWYIRTDATREKIEKEFGSVLFTENTTEDTAFITGVMSGKKAENLLSRGINAKSQFRVLGDH